MLEVTLGQITHAEADALVVYLIRGGHPSRRREVWTAQSQTLVIVVGVGAAEAFDDEVAAEAVALGLERAAAFGACRVATFTLGTGRGGLSMEASAAAVAKGVRRAGGSVPVSLLVYDPDDLEAVW